MMIDKIKLFFKKSETFFFVNVDKIKIIIPTIPTVNKEKIDNIFSDNDILGGFLSIYYATSEFLFFINSFTNSR